MKMHCIFPKTAAFVASVMVCAASSSALAQTITFAHSKIESVDRTNMIITVSRLGKGEPLILRITSQTRLFKNGQPAITADLTVGDEIHGSAHTDADGKTEAIRIYAVK